MLAQGLPEAERVLQDDDARERTLADRRHGEERGLVAARGGGDVQVGHVCRSLDYLGRCWSVRAWQHRRGRAQRGESR